MGNWIMSAWASIWSGRRFQDVESGYRAFKVGPLLDALQYYKGYKYSETVEIAVILPILGYKIHDTTLVDIPVFRSRTRMKDVIIDLVAMPCAWWRVMAARRLPKGVPTWFAYWILPLFFLAAIGGVLRILTRTIYLADDTINNYAHVWYISDRLFGSGHIPIRFAELDGGRAFTFPYGLTPWVLNALVYPLFGDWSVTLFLVLGGVAAMAGAMLVRPSMRDPWLMLLFIANPFLIDALAGGQYAFLWSAAGFFALIWCVEHRNWPPPQVVLVSTHRSRRPWRAGVRPSAPRCARGRACRCRRCALLRLLTAVILRRADPGGGKNTVGRVVGFRLPRRGSVMAPFALAWAAPFCAVTIARWAWFAAAYRRARERRRANVPGLNFARRATRASSWPSND
jgi:hypothetical protein